MQESVQCKIHVVYEVEIGARLNFMLFNSLRQLVPLTSSQDEAKTPSYRYVTGYGIARILAYSYSGSDASLLYNHVTCKGVTHRRVLGTLCLRHTGWYSTERDLEYHIGL